ncbi:MAG: FAD-binding oxidoreductase [Betaproteobacteria bacterium]|nr:FAD-binding oxidoreductase [Betaproteobacteria bacterium]
MNARTSASFSAMLDALRAAIPTDALIVAAEELEFFSLDVYGAGATPLAIVRPESVEILQAAVRIAHTHGVPMVPRGGGLSYTDGYLTKEPALVFDLSALNRIIQINTQDRYVVVEAGVTWAALDKALEAHGLRTPYWGPLSGLQSTVGGALSQGSVFFGSSQHGSAGDSVLGVEVVRADGEIVKTGSASAGNAPAFLRYFGPDLTGMFLGDCGALGFKARATLKVIERAKALDFLSFEYDNAHAALSAMAEVSRSGLASELCGFDPTLAAIRLKRASLLSDAKTLANVVKQSGLIAGAKLVMAGREFLGEGTWSLHAIIEADSEAALIPRVARAKALMGAGGKPVENSIPKALRATPFVPPNSMLGPGGERWVPVHGIVPHSCAAAAFDAIDALFESCRKEIEKHGIQIGTLITAVAQQGTLIEPVFFWPDSHTAYHRRAVESAYRAKLKESSDNPAARALVHELKRGVADTLRTLGGAHFQLGRFYTYREGRDPAALALFDAIKTALDPHRLMNPGVLR